MGACSGTVIKGRNSSSTATLNGLKKSKGISKCRMKERNGTFSWFIYFDVLFD
jgi:hypothetical protein